MEILSVEAGVDDSAVVLVVVQVSRSAHIVLLCWLHASQTI